MEGVAVRLHDNEAPLAPLPLGLLARLHDWPRLDDCAPT